MSELGKKLLVHNSNLPEVKDRLSRLNSEHEAVLRGWDEKGVWLRQCLDLQLLNKEADNIDTTTSSHEAFLEFTDLGVSYYCLSIIIKLFTSDQSYDKVNLCYIKRIKYSLICLHTCSKVV